MLRAITTAALFLALAGATAFPRAAGQDKKDPQGKFEPKSRPGEGQKYLEKFVGEWEVVKTFHPRAGEPAKSSGTCKQTMTQDGRFLDSEFTFEGAAGKTTGKGVIGFEPESGKFTSVWYDSRQTRMSFRQSEEKFDGKKIVLVGKVLGAGPGGGPVSQTTSTLDADGGTITHRQVSIDADGKERLVMELVLTRKPAK